ncbi:MAG: sporulation integral membrane protein YtvI [Defluviitaleaceae bacterium]|nr:sporulation integral membrane protein YtvI [Defluviitaleaceae bacterium]MCL2239288.1 sporulation integral membrane protein YtvI [Defluviitaleaceae bacterium]
MYEMYMRNKQIIDRMAFFALITLLVYALFTFLWDFLSPFFFGFIIALLMEPLIRLMLHRFKFKRWMAALLCLLIFLAAAASLGTWLITTLIRQVASFVEAAPTHIEDIVYRLEEWLTRFADNFPALSIPDLQDMLVSAVMGLFGDVVQDQAPRWAAAVPEFLINVILTLVSAYFFMADRERIFAAVARACPKGLAVHFRQTRKSFSQAMAGYFRAQYILMSMVGIISIIGLLIIRSPFALFLGLLLAVLDFLPIVGAGSVLIPWALLSFIIGDTRQGISLAIIYGIITITRQVLQPKILGDQIGVHPLVSLMSIFIGFRLFGLLGLIIGPTLVMLLVAARKGEERDGE